MEILLIVYIVVMGTFCAVKLHDLWRIRRMGGGSNWNLTMNVVEREVDRDEALAWLKKEWKRPSQEGTKQIAAIAQEMRDEIKPVAYTIFFNKEGKLIDGRTVLAAMLLANQEKRRFTIMTYL